MIHGLESPKHFLKILATKGRTQHKKKENSDNTHTQANFFSLTTMLTFLKQEGFFVCVPYFLQLLCNWLDPRCRGGEQALQRLPGRPIDLSSAHRLEAEGMRERPERQPAFYGSPLEPASDCSLFPQIVFHLVRAQRCAAPGRCGEVLQTFRGARNSKRP